MIISWELVIYQEPIPLTFWIWFLNLFIKNRSHSRRKNRNQRKFRTNHTNISDLISISKNNGRHYLLTKLCSLPVNRLNKILEDCNTISYSSPKYEIVQIIMAYCYSKLFPKIDRPEDHKKTFN